MQVLGQQLQQHWLQLLKQQRRLRELLVEFIQLQQQFELQLLDQELNHPTNSNHSFAIDHFPKPIVIDFNQYQTILVLKSLSN